MNGVTDDSQDRPEEYQPPRSAQELLQRYQAGERYFVGAELAGVDLTAANLSGSNFRGAFFDLANLSEANLAGANLNAACLDGAKLIGANMSGASISRYECFLPKLRSANFSAANLTMATLAGCDLREAVFSAESILVGANLRSVDLDGRGLSGIDLSRANLEEANLSSATLIGCRLTGCNLMAANFTDANMIDADLTSSVLTKATFENADLRGAVGIRLDNNYIYNAKFSANADDPWSTLRRTYTGHRFVFHLLILALFVAPYIARAIFWSGVNQAQTGMAPIISSLKESAERMQAAQNSNAVFLDQVLARANSLKPCLEENCKEWPVWQVLLGADKGWTFLVLAVALIAYNFLRGFLTWKIGPMRDEEERSGYSPAWSEYGLLFKLHQVSSVLIVVAIFSFIWHAYHWLFTSVWLPA